RAAPQRELAAAAAGALSAAPRGPRPFLPPPPPARLAPPSHRLLCVAAGPSVPAPGLRDAPSLPATSRMLAPPPGVLVVGLRPERAGETRRPR
ncbi:hypothetical protein P7K49_013518, partial [Saguinus oedipus]